MRFTRPVTIFVLAASLLGAPLAAQAPNPPDPPEPPRSHRGDGEPKVSIFNDVHVEKGERLNGIVCVQGDARIDGVVDGDVVVVMGDAVVNGTVHGNLVAVMGDIKLGDDAVLDGDLTNVGGSLERGVAQINGNVVNVSPFGLGIPGMGGWDLGSWGLASMIPWTAILELFLFFVCALVLASLVPERIRLISEEAPVRYFTALLFGFLGYIVLGMTLIFLCITLIGIPFAALLLFGFVICKWMAMCGLFHYVGTRLARNFGKETSFLGAILLGLLPFAFIRLIPTCCFGLIAWWVCVEMPAFGFLIMTRLGTKPSGPAVTVMPPAAPAPPPPSV